MIVSVPCRLSHFFLSSEDRKRT